MDVDRNIHIISNDIDFYIIQYLNIKDVIELKRVNKHYYKFVRDSPTTRTFNKEFKKINNNLHDFKKIGLPKIYRLLNCSCANSCINLTKFIFNELINKENVDNIKCLMVNNTKYLNVSFVNSCAGGNLELVKWIYKSGRININFNNEDPFLTSLYFRRYDVAKWLYKKSKKNKPINFNSRNEYAFRIVCRNGDLHMAKWLLKKCKKRGLEIDMTVSDNWAFWYSCKFGRLDFVKWMLSLNIDILEVELFQCFKVACIYGHLKIAKLIYSMNRINVNQTNNFIFRLSCKFGQVEIAKWLYSLGGIKITCDQNYAFKKSCKHHHLNVALWLCSKNNKYSLINKNGQIKGMIRGQNAI